MTPISATILTFNEERSIEQCLRSLEDVADEIIVVDACSTDRTAEISFDRDQDQPTRWIFSHP